jgi:hypothetical protein
MTTRKTTTPDWLVERLALGELDDATAADVRRRLAAEGRDVDVEREALAASSREILEAHPPARIATAVRARAAEARRPRRWLVGAPLALAGVAALVLVARPATRATTGAPGHELALEDGRIKGPAKVHVYRHGKDGDAKLFDGARAARGDLLQLTYSAGEGGRFGALLSIDGRGNVTLHWPEASAELAPRLSPKGEVKLPSAYELDDAPAFERFIFVSSENPFALSAVLQAAHALAARPADARVQRLALPASFAQDALTLEKTRKETP